MKSLLSALGVDYGQWKALTRAALKLDLRMNSWGARRGSASARGITVIIGQLVFYTFAGAAMAYLVGSVGDPFMAGLIVMSYVIVMVGTAMLVDHNTTVISTADYAILGYLPISSRTYFAARLTNVLVYTLGATTVLGWLPAGAFFLRHGVAVGAAATIALYACAICVTLAVATAYLWFVQRLGARRLQRMVSYLQLVTGFSVYGAFFIVPEFVSGTTPAFVEPTRTPWLLLYPGAWFASYIDVATGGGGVAVVLPVIASIAVVVLLAVKLGGRLSLEYAEHLAALMTAAAPVPSRPRASAITPSRWFRRGEARAVALLVRSHFRNDLKFRMGVLSILPLTLLYLFIGLRNGDGASAQGDASRLSMITIAVVLFPMMLKLNMARSDAFRASWIFFATPTDRTRLVRASIHVLVAFFVLPYLLFVGFTLIWFTDSLAYLAIYLVFAGMLSYLALLVVTCVDPELPFAKPFTKGSASARFFGAFIVIGAISPFLPLLSTVLYRSVTAAAIVFGAGIALSLLLGRITRVRVEGRAALMEFQG